MFSPDLTPGPRLSTLVAYALGVGALIGLILMRQPGVSSLETVRAEDGADFLAVAVNHTYSLVRRLVDPYAGYMHLVPRLLAELASHLPLERAAFVMSGGAVAIVAMLALFVFRASAAISHLSLRVALGGAMVLLPIGNAEALANASNLHWFFIFAAFWAFIWVPQGSIGRLVSAAIVVAATLGDPLTLLLTPLALARALAIRTWRDHLVTLALIGGGLVQLGVVWFAHNVGTGRDFLGADFYSLAVLFGTNVVAVNVVGVPMTEALWASTWAVVPWVGLAAFGAFALYTLRRPRSRLRSLALIALGMSVLFFVVTFWFSRTFEIGPTWSLTRGQYFPTRYFIVPALLLLSSFLLVAGDLARRVEGSRSPIVMIVMVWYAAVAAMSLTYPNDRSNGPVWADALAQARQECPTTASTSATIEVPIPPNGWVARLYCQYVGP